MRKYSEEIYPEDCIDQVLSTDLSEQNIRNFQANMKILEDFYKQKEKYDKVFGSKLFIQRLEIFIFKCHNPKMKKMIIDFVEKYDIQVKEPILSKYFQNKYFNSSLDKSQNESSQIVEEERQSKIQKTHQILNQIFHTYDGIPALQQLLLKFPQELIKIHSIENLIMGSQTMELSECNAYFVAICAVAQFGCQYLVNRLIKLYFKTGGEASWLDKSTCPEKMKWIYQLSAALAYNPWKIDQFFLEQIRPWSKGQIIHASTIISFYQMLSLICLTFGLNSEPSISFLNEYVKQVNSYLFPFPSTIKLSQSMMDVIHTQFDTEGRKSGRSSANTMEDTQQELKYQIMEYMKTIDKSIVENHAFQILKKKYYNFVDNDSSINMRDQQSYPFIQESQWNYEKHFYPIIHHFSGQLSKQLSIFFINDIKTTNEAHLSMFVRKCIKFYADSYMGYVHNGFNYSQNMKKVLSLRLRFFIMISIQYPFLLNKETVEKLSEDIKQQTSNQIDINILLHMSLLVGRTKMSTSLAYVTKALSQLEFKQQI